MKQLLIGSALIALGVALLIVTSRAALGLDDETTGETSRANQEACDKAARQLWKGRLLTAEKAFAALLDKAPSLICARHGLTTALTKRCRSAGRLIKAGRTGEAEKTLLAMLKDHPAQACATNLLGRSRKADCDGIRDLVNRGLKEQAKKQFEALLTRVSGESCDLRSTDLG